MNDLEKILSEHSNFERTSNGFYSLNFYLEVISVDEFIEHINEIKQKAYDKGCYDEFFKNRQTEEN